MDFYNKLKRFLGLPTQNNNDNRSHSNNIDVPFCRDHFNDKPVDEFEQFGFNVFSNPLEMHRYFERQMNEMMQSFGIFNNDSSFFGNDQSIFGGFKEPSLNYGFSQFPQEEDVYKNPLDGNLRDNFLKPGYEDPANKKSIKTDSDLDEQYRSGDFNNSIISKSRNSPQTYSFGRTMITKTIRNSDGISEVYKSVQDQNGNCEETVTRKVGDKEYTVTTRTDKNGVQEITENLLNIDDSEKDDFLKKNNSLIPDRSKDNLDIPLFEKFFGN